MKKITVPIETTGGDKATKDIDKVAASTQNLSEKSDGASGKVGGLGGAIGGLGGPLSAASSGVAGLSKAFLGLLANPVGAVIGALAGIFLTLRKALSSTEEGQNKMAKATAVLGTIFDKLMDVLEPVASFVIDVLGAAFNEMAELIDQAAKGLEASLRFFGFEDAADGLREYMGELETAATGAAKVADIRAEAEKQERILIIKRAEAERDLALLKEKAADADRFTAAERKKALEDAKRITEELSALEIERAKNLRDAIVLENSLANSSKEALAEEAKLEAELIAAETKAAQDRIKINKDEQKINKEAEARAKKAADKKAAEEKKAADEAKRILDAQNKLKEELAIAEEKRTLDATTFEINELKRKYAEKMEIAKGNTKLELELIRQRDLEIEMIEKAAADKKLAAEADMNKAQLEADLAAKQARYDAGLDDPNATPEELLARYEAVQETQAQIDEMERTKAEEDFQAGLITQAERDAIVVAQQKKHADEQEKINAAIAANDKLLQDTKIKAAMAAVGILASFANDTKEQQAAALVAEAAVAIGTTVMNAAAANAGALAQGIVQAGPIAGPAIAAPAIAANNIMAGVSIAGIIAGKAKALATLGKSGQGGGSSAPPRGGSASAPSVSPQTLFPTQDLEGETPESIGDNTAGLRQNVIKAIVVERDITNTQNNIRGIEERATIG